MLKLSKLCNKFALKHNQSDAFDDGGIWVARGFVSTKKSGNGSKWELSVIGNDPTEAAEKFMTMLNEHYDKYDLVEQPTTNQHKNKKGEL
jgi:hypothetical protein